ncbi:MFS transporter [Stenotrophomonas nematodicola]|uniref:MFS transporter n=1 Tax=Stenotrophomonas nematodicola TaxID=2656746 RepID=UPI001E5E85EF|nr:MFS transporter [Stenotrophomonas nematodicola]
MRDAEPMISGVPAAPAGRSRSMLIAGLSTVVEWYDFTLYLYLATVVSRVFFGGGEHALLATLAGFAVSYLMHPLGALCFGHLGDRFGRRVMMLASMLLMTVAMLATALLPTFATLGTTAGVLLLLLRCLMAFSVGGEYTGVVAYLLESAPPRRRGLITSLASAASEVGALLAVGLSALTVALLSTAQLDAWGWRIPFFVGAALAGAILLARSRMQESPEFERQQAAGTVPVSPIRDTWRHHRSAVARTFAISALGSITYYVGITYVPAFLGSVGKVGESTALWLSTVAAVAVIGVTPLAGALSDRIGRRPVLIALALLSALLPLGMFAVMAAGSTVQIAVAAVVLACLAGGVSAVAAPATAEQFPGEGRLSGLALGVTMATAFFGGATPLVAELLVRHSGWSAAPGAMIALVAVLVLPVMWTLRETRPQNFQRRLAETKRGSP